MERGFIRSQKELGYCLNFTRSLYGNHGWEIGLSDRSYSRGLLGSLSCQVYNIIMMGLGNRLLKGSAF